MHEYIKRSDAITEINRGDLLVGNNAEWAREIIWRTPYADVVEVKHGRWIHVADAEYECNQCRNHVCFDEQLDRSVPPYNYCPNCGAKMEDNNGCN